jgi:transposase-like protein
MSGTSYRLDETYAKAGTEWKYLYRAIDSHGQTIEFMLSARRDVPAAKRFFKKMMRADHRRLPFTIGADKHASYPEAFAASVEDKSLPIDCGLRRVKCLNNVIEQGHRAIRRRWRAMQRSRPFHTAERTIEGNRSCAHDEERTGQKIGRQARGGAGEVSRETIWCGGLKKTLLSLFLPQSNSCDTTCDRSGHSGLRSSRVIEVLDSQ